MSDSDRVDEAVRAYQVPPPPPGLADRVASEILAATVAPPPGRWRRVLAGAALVGAGAAVAAGAIALARMPGGVAAGERAPAERETIALGRRAILVAEGGSAVAWRPGAGRSLTINQSQGNVFYRVESGPFVVETPRGAVHVRGTCFRVEVKDMKLNRQAITGAAVGAAVASAVLVTVYEGRVSLASGDKEVDVAAGQAGTMSKDEAPRLAETPAVAEPAVAARPAAAPEAAGRELQALRARVAEQEKELERVRAQLTPDKQHNMIDPSREELLARAQRCEIDFHYPNFDEPTARKVDDRQARKLGLSDTEREAADEILRDIHAEVPATLRKLYGEMSGDPALAGRLTPSALLTEIMQKAPENVAQQTRTRIARERAGLQPPPVDPSAATPAEKALRLYEGLGYEFERRLAERLGPERAHALQKLRESWGNTSSISGCQGQ